MNVFNLVRLAYKIFPNFTTDLSIGQVAGYIYTVLTGSIEGIWKATAFRWTERITV